MGVVKSTEWPASRWCLGSLEVGEVKKQTRLASSAHILAVMSPGRVHEWTEPATASSETLIDQLRLWHHQFAWYLFGQV